MSASIGLVIQDTGTGSVQVSEYNNDTNIVSAPILTVPVGMPAGDFVAALSATIRVQLDGQPDYESIAVNPTPPQSYTEGGHIADPKPSRW